jgi:hypothetical protein
MKYGKVTATRICHFYTGMEALRDDLTLSVEEEDSEDHFDSSITPWEAMETFPEVVTQLAESEIELSDPSSGYSDEEEEEEEGPGPLEMFGLTWNAEVDAPAAYARFFAADGTVLDADDTGSLGDVSASGSAPEIVISLEEGKKHRLFTCVYGLEHPALLGGCLADHLHRSLRASLGGQQRVIPRIEGVVKICGDEKDAVKLALAQLGVDMGLVRTEEPAPEEPKKVKLAKVPKPAREREGRRGCKARRKAREEEEEAPRWKVKPIPDVKPVREKVKVNRRTDVVQSGTAMCPAIADHEKVSYAKDLPERAADDLPEGPNYECKDSYESAEDYRLTFRAAVIREYDAACEEKSRLHMEGVTVHFEGDDRESRGQKQRKWTASFPAPSRYFQSEEVQEISNTHVSLSDGVILSWVGDDGARKQIEGQVRSITRRFREGTIVASFTLPGSQVPPGFREGIAQANTYECDVGFRPDDVIYKRRLSGIRVFSNRERGDPILEAVLSGKVEASVSDEDEEGVFGAFHATKAQTRALRVALSNPVTLIQGPPGTGKTAVIAALVIEMLAKDHNHHPRVLVCAHSNQAVVNLVRAVLPAANDAGKKVVHLSNRSYNREPGPGATPEQKAHSYAQLFALSCEEAREWQELERNHDDTPRKRLLRDLLEASLCSNADIVLSTLESAQRSCLSEIEFATVIVDEATQAAEPSMLVPLVHGATRMVLVGDQKQLGPVGDDDELRMAGYYESMFERLAQTSPEAVQLLTQQYRMHPQIARFANNEFYKGRICNGVSEEQRQSPGTPFSRSAILFQNVPGEEVAEGTSYRNANEACAVVDLYERLRAAHIADADIGIITPYNAQVRYLKQRLSETQHPDLKIASVDSFQGGERKYILFSCVRTNERSIGFLRDPRRLNVAVTRAQFGLAIVGCRSALVKDRAREFPHWRNLINFCKRHGELCSAMNPVAVSRTREAIVIQRAAEREDPFAIDRLRATISGGEVRVIWPDDHDWENALNLWMQPLVGRLNAGEKLTVALDTESICVQVGEIFGTFDVLEGKPDDLPEVGNRVAMIVFFHTRQDVPDARAVKAMAPLFTHRNLTIATFDLTLDVLKLKELGVEVNRRRLLDAQLWRMSSANPLTCKDVKTLARAIRVSSRDDPMAERAQSHEEEKGRPWEELHFVIESRGLPETVIVTRRFLEYAANDVALTGLALAEVIRRGFVQQVQRATQQKLKKVDECEGEYGSVIAGMHVRQLAFMANDLPAIEGGMLRGDGLRSLLEQWEAWRAIISAQECNAMLDRTTQKLPLEEKKRRRDAIAERIMSDPDFVRALDSLANDRDLISIPPGGK